MSELESLEHTKLCRVVYNTLGQPDQVGTEQLCFAFAISTDLQNFLIPDHFRIYANKVMNKLEHELRSIEFYTEWSKDEVELLNIFKSKKTWISLYKLIKLLEENQTSHFSVEVRVKIMDLFSIRLNKVINELNEFSLHYEQANKLKRSIQAKNETKPGILKNYWKKK